MGMSMSVPLLWNHQATEPLWRVLFRTAVRRRAAKSTKHALPKRKPQVGEEHFPKLGGQCFLTTPSPARQPLHDCDTGEGYPKTKWP